MLGNAGTVRNAVDVPLLVAKGFSQRLEILHGNAGRVETRVVGKAFQALPGRFHDPVFGVGVHGGFQQRTVEGAGAPRTALIQ